jgi:hypothetical protein
MPDSTDPRLQLAPPAPRAYAVAAALLVGLPLVLQLVVAPLAPALPDAFPHSIGAGALASRLVGALVVLAVTSAAYGALVLLMRRHRLHLDAGGLEIATTFYRRRLAWGDLRLDAARVIAIDERPELKPALKSNGVGLPGFRSGWFRSRKLGRQFVATSGGSKLLWLPTRLGYDVLLQPRQPAAVLEAIQALAAAASNVAPGRSAR